MKKKIYKKPEIQFDILQNEESIMVGSGFSGRDYEIPDEEIERYDDWLGSRQQDGIWDNE